MKKVALLFSALALVLALSQCKKVRPDMPHYSGPVGDMYIQHVNVNASHGSSNSKVNGSQIGNELNLTWEEGDELNVYNQTKKGSLSPLSLKGKGGSDEGQFEGNITGTDGDNLTFYYKGSSAEVIFNEGAVTYAASNFAGQDGSLEGDNGIFKRLAIMKKDVGFPLGSSTLELSVPYAILKLDLRAFGTATGNEVKIYKEEETEPIATVFNVKDNSNVMYVALPTDNLWNEEHPIEKTFTFTNDDSKKSIAMKWKIQQNYFYTAKGTDGAAIEVKPEPQVLPNYVCFEAVQAGSTINLTSSFGVPSDISYSTDGNNWTPFTATVTLAKVEDKCYFKTNTPRDNLSVSFVYMPSITAFSKFECTGNLKVSGNIMALLNSETPATEMTDANANCFQQLFQYCTAIIDASELVLPATTLAANCYMSMFSGCTNLTAAPNLPATTLAASCYNSMFYNCENLTEAPTISVTEVATNCCHSMFSGCSSLTDASKIILSAANAESCYHEMFSDCSKLTTAPNMSITAVADNCCNNMFCGCSSLTDASSISLNAKTLANNCYFSMFGPSASKACCSSLKYAPTMSATTAAFHCCDQMFSNCPKLEDVSKIAFAETVAEQCYENMFVGCESLESVSELPAANLETYCYHLMFSGCAKLSSVTMKATDINATGCLSDWLQGAGTDGSVSSRTVYVASGMVDDVKATVPDNWKSGVQVKP